MRTLGFLTALLLGTVSASAQPDRYRDRDVSAPVEVDVHIDTDGDRYERWDRDLHNRDRYTRWDRARDARGRWIPLMKYSDARNGRQFVDVDGRGGRMDQLRIEAVRGRPVIKRIAIEYGNGRREVLRVDAQLRRGQGQVIDLPRERRIERIVVISDRRSPGVYSVYGG